MEICPDQEGEEKHGGSHTELDALLAQEVPATAGVHAADDGSETHEITREEIVVPEDVTATGVAGGQMTNNTQIVPN